MVAVLLDTATVAECDRADLIAATLNATYAPVHMVLHDRDSAASGRIEGWQLGTTGLVRMRSIGFRSARTWSQVRHSPSPDLLLNMSPTSTARWTQGDVLHEAMPGTLTVSDFSMPFEVDWCGGEGISLAVPLQELDVSTETIRRAAYRLPSSSLHSLVADQILLMADTAEALACDPAAVDLGAAYVDMMRALLISAADSPGDDGTALPADILLTRIRDYVERHLTDPDLTPASIARAHHISVSHLYRLCARANFSLHQWTIARRLDRIHRDLADPKHRHRPIATIAQHYGFRAPSHFTHRFRAAYGMTPQEWRHTAFPRRPS